MSNSQSVHLNIDAESGHHGEKNNTVPSNEVPLVDPNGVPIADPIDVNSHVAIDANLPTDPKNNILDNSDEEESEGSKGGNRVVEEPQIEGEANIDCEQEAGTVHAEEVAGEKSIEGGMFGFRKIAKVEAPEAPGQQPGSFVAGEGEHVTVGYIEVVTRQDVSQVQEPGSLNADPKRFGSYDWTDTEEEEEKLGEAEVGKKSTDDSDDEALINLIATLKKRKQTEEKTIPKRGALEKALEEIKKKKKEMGEGVRLIDESDVEEMELVSGKEDEEEEEEEEEEVPL
ncbi:uncharacterized protein [Nicotiana tomentosiformis]|uniref:uncharacterized protein n=1 Tax=Nicotiana tomentosiformis TaxID=4098 RepID=UPI00388C4204